jgi:2-amino-4-hydroxy-6-hydroxymethyldihydropteridine diphosphokinase
VPHPRLHERRFALEPLSELAPDALIPGRGQVAAVLAELH